MCGWVWSGVAIGVGMEARRRHTLVRWQCEVCGRSGFTSARSTHPTPSPPSSSCPLHRACSLQPVFVLNSSYVKTLPVHGGSCRSQFSSSAFNSVSSLKSSISFRCALSRRRPGHGRMEGCLPAQLTQLSSSLWLLCTNKQMCPASALHPMHDFLGPIARLQSRSRRQLWHCKLFSQCVSVEFRSCFPPRFNVHIRPSKRYSPHLGPAPASSRMQQLQPAEPDVVHLPVDQHDLGGAGLPGRLRPEVGARWPRAGPRCVRGREGGGRRRRRLRGAKPEGEPPRDEGGCPLARMLMMHLTTHLVHPRPPPVCSLC